MPSFEGLDFESLTKGVEKQSAVRSIMSKTLNRARPEFDQTAVLVAQKLLAAAKLIVKGGPALPVEITCKELEAMAVHVKWIDCTVALIVEVNADSRRFDLTELDSEAWAKTLQVVGIRRGRFKPVNPGKYETEAQAAMRRGMEHYKRYHKARRSISYSRSETLALALYVSQRRELLRELIAAAGGISRPGFGAATGGCFTDAVYSLFRWMVS